MKTGFSDYIERWRHTLGYGVHSPLAFRIVKECLHPESRYAMYADDYIDSVYSYSDRTARRRAYLLVRLVNTLLPHSIWMPGADRRIEDAVRQSFRSIHISRARVCPKNADFIAVFDDTDTAAAWKLLAGCENACLISFAPRQSVIPEGADAPTLTICGRRYSVFLRRKGMAPVSYTVI